MTQEAWVKTFSSVGGGVKGASMKLEGGVICDEGIARYHAMVSPHRNVERWWSRGSSSGCGGSLTPQLSNRITLTPLSVIRRGSCG